MFKIQNFIIFSFTMLNTLKLYHWTTNSYSNHKNIDELINNLQNNIDNFVETYLGINNKNFVDFDLQIKLLKDNDIKIELHKYIKYIKSINTFLKSNTELINILDEITNNLNKALYLCNLK